MTAGTASRGVRGERRAEMLTGDALVAIPLLLYATLFFGAMIYAAYISLWRWGLRGARNFLGFGNYEDILSDPIFWKAVTNTLYYVAVWVPLTMALGLFLAVIVNLKLRGQTFWGARVLLHENARQFGGYHGRMALPAAAGRPVQRHPRGQSG